MAPSAHDWQLQLWPLDLALPFPRVETCWVRDCTARCSALTSLGAINPNQTTHGEKRSVRCDPVRFEQKRLEPKWLRENERGRGREREREGEGERDRKREIERGRARGREKGRGERGGEGEGEGKGDGDERKKERKRERNCVASTPVNEAALGMSGFWARQVEFR